MKLMCILWATMVLSGCSASAAISKKTNDIAVLAADTKVLIEKKPAAWEGKAIENLDTIVENTGDVHKLLTSVEDKVPWWGTLLTSAMVFLSILGCAFLLWYLGLGALIRKILNALGLLIPKATVQEASLLKKAADDQDPATIREYIAAKRLSDPTFNAAYKKEK